MKRPTLTSITAWAAGFSSSTRCLSAFMSRGAPPIILRQASGTLCSGLSARFYSHHPKTAKPDETGKRDSNFAISTYPQLLLSNPTSSVRRYIVEPGPQFLLPVEANAKIGPIHMSGEYGYWFANKAVPPAWIRGMIVGHEFKNKNEVDLEFYDLDDTKGTPLWPKARETTLGIGFRTPLVKKHSLWFLAMVGPALSLSLGLMDSQVGSPLWASNF